MNTVSSAHVPAVRRIRLSRALLMVLLMAAFLPDSARAQCVVAPPATESTSFESCNTQQFGYAEAPPVMKINLAR